MGTLVGRQISERDAKEKFISNNEGGNSGKEESQPLEQVFAEVNMPSAQEGQSGHPTDDSPETKDQGEIRAIS